MKIIQLQAENIKRLKAVQITPTGHVQVIAGRNAQGKTSVLDAIWLALGGGPASKATARPIRDGETTATVRLDLGDLVVTRTWTGDKTTLKVESADGAKFSSPQKMLDDLVGRLSFDPLAFTQLPPKAQRDALLSLVELPFDPAELDRKRTDLFDRRTDIGRQGKALGDVPTLIEGVPEKEVSAAALIEEMQAAHDAGRNHADAQQAVTTWEERISDLEEELDTARARLEAAESRSLESATVLPDYTALEQQLEQVEDTNRHVRTNEQTRAHAARHKRITDEYQALTDSIAKLDKEKSAGLAKAVFPIDGLGFDQDGITYAGRPFMDACSMEQIQVSTAIAMALNPKLRVLRILDGSLLDADNLAVISEMVAEKDYQLWIERVGTDDATAVVIEDGAVA